MDLATPLTKLAYKGKEINIYGTYSDPLFPALEVAKIMLIKDPNAAVSGLAVFKRKTLRIEIANQRVDTILATVSGVGALRDKTKQTVAGDFDRWIYETAIPALKKLKTERKAEMKAKKKAERKEAQKLESAIDSLEHFDNIEEISQHDEIIDEPIEEIATTYEPIEEHTAFAMPMIKVGNQSQEGDSTPRNTKIICVPMYTGDINEFADKPVVYLLYIRPSRPDQEQYDYKFGQTGDIYERLSTHSYDFKRLDYSVEIVKIWSCASMKVMQTIEKQIKVLARSRGFLTTRHNKTEIITTDDIWPVIACIDNYVKHHNSLECRPYEIATKQLDIELKTVEEKIRSHDLEIAKLNNLEGQRERNRELELLIIMKKLDLGLSI